MKKIIVSSMVVAGLFASSGAFAAETQFCDGGSAASDSSATGYSGATGNFMKSAIKVKCSANVRLSGNDAGNGAAYAVAAASAKGQNIFGGHTNGGSVAPKTGGGCATKGACLQSEVTSHLATMVAAAQTNS